MNTDREAPDAGGAGSDRRRDPGSTRSVRARPVVSLSNHARPSGPGFAVWRGETGATDG